MTTSFRPLVNRHVCFLIFALYSLGCSCEDSNIVAKLVEYSGTVERDWAARLEQWENATTSEQFAYGDGIRTLENANATLKLFDGSHMKLDPITAIRFHATAPGNLAPALIDVMTGEAEIEVGHSDLNVQTEMGLATVESRGRFKLRKTKDGTVFMVSIGKAIFVVDKDGIKQSVEVKAGEQIKVALGEAIVENIIETSDEPPQEDTGAAVNAKADSDTSEKLDATYEGEQTDSEPKWGLQPDRADFLAPLGTSFKVHSPRLPVVLEVQLEHTCPFEGIIKLFRKEKYLTSGKKARVSLAAGRVKYQVFCVNDKGEASKRAAVSSSISVVKDSGKARIAGRTPPSFVDADGRSYKILYQNRLPKVTFSWPRAPEDTGFVLELKSKGTSLKKISTKKPNYTFSPGSLKDGIHTLKFRATHSGRFSKTTTVKISFDNATPTAKFKDPTNGSFGSGDQLNISGVAAPGWKVSMTGAELLVDDHNRFAGQYTYRGIYRSIAVRLAHPRRGVHYYLRQAAGSGN